MKNTEIKNALLAMDDEILIDWYNNEVIDPYEDFYWATIRENDGCIPQFPSLFELETLIELCKAPETKYNPSDKYYMIFSDRIISFNSFAELLDMDVTDGLEDYIADCGMPTNE